MVGVQNVNTGRGTLFFDHTSISTTRPPEIVVDQAAQTSTNGTGLVTITSSLFDQDGDRCRVRIEASVDQGVSWFVPWIESVSSTYTSVLSLPTDAYQLVQVTTTNASGYPSTNTISLVWDTLNTNNVIDFVDEVYTNTMFRMAADDRSLTSSLGTQDGVLIDNLGPSPNSAVLAINTNATYSMSQDLFLWWANFHDSHSPIGGYYFDTSDGGGNPIRQLDGNKLGRC